MLFRPCLGSLLSKSTKPNGSFFLNINDNGVSSIIVPHIAVPLATLPSPSNITSPLILICSGTIFINPTRWSSVMSGRWRNLPAPWSPAQVGRWFTYAPDRNASYPRPTPRKSTLICKRAPPAATSPLEAAHRSFNWSLRKNLHHKKSSINNNISPVSHPLFVLYFQQLERSSR